MHKCVSKVIIIGSDNGLSPSRHQAIIWTDVGILLIKPLRINFSENLIEINTFSFKKMPLKLSSAKWHLFHLGLNELIHTSFPSYIHDQYFCFVCRGVGLHYFSNRLFWLANGGLLMLSTNRGNSYAKLELPSSGKLATFALSHQSNILSKSPSSFHCTILKLKESGGQFNIKRCHLTSKGFPIIKMRCLWEHLIFIITEIPIYLILNWLPGHRDLIHVSLCYTLLCWRLKTIIHHFYWIS